MNAVCTGDNTDPCALCPSTCGPGTDLQNTPCVPASTTTCDPCPSDHFKSGKIPARFYGCFGLIVFYLTVWYQTGVLTRVSLVYYNAAPGKKCLEHVQVQLQIGAQLVSQDSSKQVFITPTPCKPLYIWISTLDRCLNFVLIS